MGVSMLLCSTEDRVNSWCPLGVTISVRVLSEMLNGVSSVLAVRTEHYALQILIK